MSQNTEFFITTVARTSDPIKQKMVAVLVVGLHE
jgi:hypothetical protein